LKPLCFIGARGGSKGVFEKNIRKLNKHPLIHYTIKKAIKSNLFSHVIVSTDSDRIAKIAKKSGADVPYMRPKKLATSTASMLDVLIHGIKKLRKLEYEFDVIVCLDATVPFLKTKDIDRSIRLLRKHNCDQVVGVYKQHLNPYFNMVEKNSKGFLEFSKKLKTRPKRRQDAPIVYQLTGLYVFDVKQFLKYSTILSPKTLPYEIELETGLMIDHEIEFKIADLLVQHKILDI
jgi:CMP-N-acetylneuraminic acid synthetase